MPKHILIGGLGATLIAFSVSAAAASKGKALGSENAKHVLTDSSILIPTPLGGGFRINYGRGGRLSGSSGIFSLNSAWGSSDRGKWWVRNGQVCQKWNTWYKGKPYCFKLRLDGKTVYWTRNDGLSGKAELLK